MTRVVDEAATELARAKHWQGQEYLNAVFGWDEFSAAQMAEMRRREFPAMERARRRKKGRAQRRARRSNRS